MIAKTKSSRVSIKSVLDGITFTYELVPAASRTHYGALEWGIPTTSGGTPYAYQAKRTDDAWLVKDRAGNVIGLLEHWGDGEWSVSKVKNEGPTPQWLRSKHYVPDTTVYELSSTLLTGKTAVAALERAW